MCYINTWYMYLLVGEGRTGVFPRGFPCKSERGACRKKPLEGFFGVAQMYFYP